MAKNYIKNLRPTNYVSELEGAGVSGTINANGNKELIQINCSVDGLGSFDANGPAAQPNLHPLGWDKAEALAARAKEIVDAVNAELLES